MGLSTLYKMITRRPRPSHPPHKPRKKVIKGPDGKIIDLSKKLRKKSKPKVSSTARDKAIASRAVKPKAKRLIINKHNPHINRSKQRGK